MGQMFSSGTNSTTQQATTGTNTNTSNNGSSVNYQLNPFTSGLTSNINSALATASMPVYGAPQEAQFLNQNNANTNNSVNNLQSQLASRGISNSGANAAGVSEILQNSNSNVANYQASIP